MASYLLAEDEEGGAVFSRRECVEHPARGQWMRTVIESERDARLPGWSAVDDAAVYLERREDDASRGKSAQTHRQRANHGKIRFTPSGCMQRKPANPGGRCEKGETSGARHRCSCCA